MAAAPVCQLCLQPLGTSKREGNNEITTCSKCKPYLHNSTESYKMEFSSAVEPQILVEDGASSNPDSDDLLYCTLCDKAFDKTLQYQNHMRYHRAIRRFPCVHCSKSFTQSNNLRTHLRIHTNERPFKCAECGKAFTQVTNLNNHIRLHTGERPYVCSVPGCDKAFAQVTNLNNHRRSHQKDMPYACNLCDKIFSQQNHLTMHRQVHGQQFLRAGLDACQLTSLTCLACGENFTEERLLKKHVRESCKEGGIPGPNIKIPGYYQESTKRKCFFGDCQEQFDDMPTLHTHLSKDHGMLINPHQNKARRYVPRISPNISIIPTTIKKEPPMPTSPERIPIQRSIPQSPISLSPPSSSPTSTQDIKILDMEVTEETGNGNCYTSFKRNDDIKNDFSDSEDSFSSDDEDIGGEKVSLPIKIKGCVISNCQEVKLVCSKCFSTFRNPAALDRHVKSKHG